MKSFLLLFLFAGISLGGEQFAPKAISERRGVVSEPSQTLFANGKADFEIVVPAKAVPVAKFAAQELALHLGKVLGTFLNVRSVKSGNVPALIVGDTEFARQHNIDPDKVDRDGFYIKSIGNDILLIGKDDASPLREHCQKGTLHAVYDFLERFAGVRFYFPGEIGTVTPRLKSWKVPRIDICERPDFQYRRTYAINQPQISPSKDRVVWYEKVSDVMNQYQLANYRNRMQTREIPNCHGLAALGLVERFGKSHPEYFALDNAGQRKNGEQYSHPNDKAGQICFSNPGLREEIYCDAKAILTRQTPESRNALLPNGKSAWKPQHHYPGEFFSVMPNDSCYLCRCPECWKYFAKASDGVYPQEVSDYIWSFKAGIARQLKKEGVPGFVTAMAYSQYRALPTIDLPDNMIVQTAVTGPWNEGKKAQKTDDELIRKWHKKLGNKIYLWTYPSKYWIRIGSVPNFAPRAVGNYFLRQAPHIFGAFIEAETDRWIFGYLNYYMFGRVMWNHRTDVESVIAEHNKLMFGDAAPEMTEILNSFERHWINDICGAEVMTPIGPAPMIPGATELWGKIYSKAERDRIDALFAAAAKKSSGDPDSSKRVAFFREQLWSPMLHAATTHERLVADRSNLKLYAPALNGNEKIMVDGFFDEPVWKRAQSVFLVPKNKGNNEKVAERTRVRMAHDAEYLYFAVECDEPDMATTVAPVRVPDTHEIWQDNCIELFLAVSPVKNEGIQLLINSAGSISDCRFAGKLSDWKWDSNAEYKIGKAPGKWMLELRLPRRNGGLEQNALVANIARHRVIKGAKNTYDVWSPYITGANRETENFGKVEFSPASSQNLIDNGDFTAPVRGKRFSGKWFSSRMLKPDEKIFRSGGVSMRLDEDVPTLCQYLDFLKPNTKYRLSFDIKTEDVKPLKARTTGVYIRFDLANGKALSFPGGTGYLGTTPWNRQVFEFTTPAGIKTRPGRMYIRFNRPSDQVTGVAYVDNVELIELIDVAAK